MSVRVLRCLLAPRTITPLRVSRHYASSTTRPITTTTTTTTTTSSTPTTTMTVSEAIKAMTIQPQYYAKIHIQNKAYIVTKGDVIHLPVTLKGTQVGDVLTVTAISTVGSRDYTLAAPPPRKRADTGRVFLPVGQHVTCRVTVVEHTKQPMLTTIKHKRRNRYVKAIKSKQPYTVLRVSTLTLGNSS